MEKYSNLIIEALDDKFKDKLTEDYKSLKRCILLLIEESVKDTSDLVNVQNFINNYISDQTKFILIGFVDDNDIYDTYLKYQGNIDEICLDKKFFDKSAVEYNVYSLYDYVIKGTKFGVLECMKILQNELF